MKRAIVICLVMAMLFSTEVYGVGLNSRKNQPAVLVAAAAAEESEAAQGQTAEEKSRDLTEDFRCR